MDTLMKANIFFFVSTIAVIVFTLVLVLLMIHVMRFFSSLRLMMKKIELAAGEMSEDAKEMLEDIKQSFIFRLLFPHKRKAKRQK